MSGVLAVVLAGGEGTRLMPLTTSRSKPAVPFAGSYRLIDFALNNLVNSNIMKIYIPTQFKSQSLYLHLKKGWNISGISGCFIDPIPAQMRLGKKWYDGTADSVFQNLSFIQQEKPDYICVFGSDHIYKMDVSQMLAYHKKKKASVTVAAVRVPIADAKAFGVIEIDKDGRITGFEEKPENPKPIPGDSEHALVSMGNYIFTSQVLYDSTARDAENPYSSRDFGKDIIPELYRTDPVYVYDFCTNEIAGEEDHRGYWRDVGDLDSYWQAHMDLLDHPAKFSLYNPHWPLHTYYPPLPPTRVRSMGNTNVNDSLVSAGCIIRDSSINRCVIGFECAIGSGSVLENVILIGEVNIGNNCRIKNAIIDKDTIIHDGCVIGENPEDDKKRFTVSKGGICVIAKGAEIR